jgi:KTSC domain-containing protein
MCSGREEAARFRQARIASSARFRPMPSTIIRSFAYRPATEELEVLFTTGRRYLYREVPPRAAEAFRAAFSKGRHFNTRIRGHYPYEEIEPAEAAV